VAAREIWLAPCFGFAIEKIDGGPKMVNPNPLENGDSRAFWQGLLDGRLLFQKCRSCGNVQFPPRHQCAICWHPELDSVDSSGRGRIESVTIVRRAPTPAFRGKVPYVVAAIAMEEGPRMITNLVGENAMDAVIGAPVVVTFEPGESGTMLAQFSVVANA